ncbi:MAG: hypothetical protein ACKVZH_02960 [Blastocatellia bacterium]
MTTTERNLWPQDLFTAVETQRTPLALMREQATLLGEQTRNLVEAKVVTSTQETIGGDLFIVRSNTTQFVQTFNLVSPALSNYTYQLFRVIHPVEGFPLKVLFEDSEYAANSEEELVATLKVIFAHEKTRRVIKAMIAQSRS